MNIQEAVEKLKTDTYKLQHMIDCHMFNCPTCYVYMADTLREESFDWNKVDIDPTGEIN